jgi:hypothetical protein
MTNSNEFTGFFQKVLSNIPRPLKNPIIVVLLVIVFSLLTSYILYLIHFTKTQTKLQVDSPPVPTLPLQSPLEVFHISDQKYNYQQAKCKCASYGARLATVNELNNAYEKGADWCDYGWSDNGQAYYPTQLNTYIKLRDELNQARMEKGKKPKKNPMTMCGYPGLNGGTFNHKFEFGVNCYGIKPAGKIKKVKPIVIPPVDVCTLPNNKQLTSVQQNDTIVPFNPNKWSYFY